MLLQAAEREPILPHEEQAEDRDRDERDGVQHDGRRAARPPVGAEKLRQRQPVDVVKTARRRQASARPRPPPGSPTTRNEPDERKRQIEGKRREPDAQRDREPQRQRPARSPRQRSVAAA